MTTPKEALRVAETYFKTECLNRKCSESERNLYQMILAAIPVAELEHEAMKLLVRFGIFVGIQHSSPEYVEWRDERARLLAKLEALK